MRTQLVSTRSGGRATAGMSGLWPGVGDRLLTTSGTLSVTASGATPLVSGAVGSALRLEAATTNFVLNPSFETGTTGWSTSGTNAIAQVSTQAQSGAAALRCTYNNHTTLAFINSLVLPSAGAYTLSAWVYIPADWDGGRIEVHPWSYVGSTAGASVQADMSRRDQWQRIWQTFTAVSGDLDGQPVVVAASAPTAGRVIYVDAVQVEAGTRPSSYADGSLGSGYAWTGTAHASTSTRTAASLQASGVWLDPVRGSVAAWLRPEWAASANEEHTVLHRRATAGQEWRLFSTTAGVWRLEIQTGGSIAAVEAAATHASGAAVVLAATWDERSVGIAVGGQLTVAARTLPPPDLRAATSLMLGRDAHQALHHVDATLGPVAGFARVLRAAEISALANLARPLRWGEPR